MYNIRVATLACCLVVSLVGANDTRSQEGSMPTTAQGTDTARIARAERMFHNTCPECFARSLSCGKLSAQDTVFSCIHELHDSLASDE